jgi:lysophospholipase L1-like esterase
VAPPAAAPPAVARPALWPGKPALVALTLAALVTIPQFIPYEYEWRLFDWATVPALLEFRPRPEMVEAAGLAESPAEITPVKQTSSRLQDPGGTLEPFFSSLYELDSGNASKPVRILHYGDSPTTGDLITADVRELLQQRFGDGGHGTYLIAKPWAWYAHRGMDVASEGWTINPATWRKERDGCYGLAGVSFTGQAGAWSTIKLRRAGHSRVSISYQALPGGGVLELTAGDQPIGTLTTAGEARSREEITFRLPEGARSLSLKVTQGPVRVYSATFLKDQPGVIYDSLGLNGTWAGVLASYVNEAHWAGALKAAEPDLVVVNYGTNESGFPKYIETTYEKDIREIVRRVRTALPNTPMLLMSPMDRGSREAAGQIGTIPSLPKLVALQSKVAVETGIAFFNTFEAMGGPGTMGRWYTGEPRLVSADFIHPMPAGARIVGTLFYQALLDGFNRYKLKQLRQTIAEARPK